MIPTEMYQATISQLLSPIAPYLRDSGVSEILINGPQQIFVERRGRLERTDARFEDAEAVLCALRAVAQYTGQFIDERAPVLEARLPDGSRLEAVTAPIAQDGPVVAIRRFAKSTMTLARLVELDALPPDAAQALAAFTAAKCNIVVAGGTGSGKTSLLNVLGACIPAAERVLVLEDTRELAILREHVVYLEARKADEAGEHAVTIRDLFRASLRMRPDRIVIGEIRGAEALDMVQAMVSGHGGGLTTLHATDPRDTLTRLETMCMMSDVNMPLAAIRMQIGSGIDLIVQVARLRDGSRKVTHITEVAFDLDHGRYQRTDLFVRRYRNVSGQVHSELVPTGALPTFRGKLEEHAVALPESMLQAHARSS
ncbi:MAG TPA: ATPase, T2SS/T4P/T4SS family [Polyangiales bacterium]|nr:ATPase, T2SS/T4P/T4SS family [Polyangiales bacterium]